VLAHYTPEEEAWFFSFVELGGSCPALWTAGRIGHYGVCRFRGRQVRAHRLAFAMHRDLPLEDIEGADVLHLCASNYSLDDFTSCRCVTGEHLKLGDALENGADRIRDGRAANGSRNGTWRRPQSRNRGSKNGNSVLTEADVFAIRNQFAANVPAQTLARHYQMDVSTILDAVRGHTWIHVGGPLVNRDRDLHPRGDKASWTKLTEADVRVIRQAWGRGVPLKVLAERFGVSRSTVSMIGNRLTWRHV
jgi:Sigma-70, region 4